MRTIKIQSISDVITNSSSEVYLIINERTIETMYEILEGFLGENAKELFKIRINSVGSLLGDDDFMRFLETEDPNIHEILEKLGPDEAIKQFKSDTLDEVLDYERLVELSGEFYFRNRYDMQVESFNDPVIEVIPLVKSERLGKIAGLLENIPFLFDHDIREG